MSKIIDERLCTEYPGMVRTITIFNDTEIGIEYNYQYSNEIGHRFQKFYNTPEDLIEEISLFIKNSQKLELDDDDEIKKLGRKSNFNLIKNTIDGTVLLPSGFTSKANLDSLKELYKIYSEYYRDSSNEE